MNKAFPIQRSKILTAYGGVGSNVETIDNLSLMIRPFDEWNLYEKLQHVDRHKNLKRLLFKEDRLCARLKAIGFDKLEQFFLLEDFANETPVKPWAPIKDETDRMVTSLYFPRWFYCPRCRQFKPIEEWRESWKLDKDWDKHIPACNDCSSKANRGIHRFQLQQIRFVMASMETGEIQDIPWKKIFEKQGQSDVNGASVWYIDDNTSESNILKFKMSASATDLYGLFVVNEQGRTVTMAELMTRYIVITDNDGHQIAFKPIVRNANNVYFGYNISSVFIPRKIIEQEVIDQIKELYGYGIKDSSAIKSAGKIQLTKEDIQAVIDSGFAPQAPITYTNEEEFRADEFDFLTDSIIYRDGMYSNEEGKLISEKYEWAGKPSFISNIYFQRIINVTSVQVAYSRIDKIGMSSLPSWKGRSEMPKVWFNPETRQMEKMDVKLHPTCKEDINRVNMLPVASSYGEGFFVELRLSTISQDDRLVFLHTFCHLIMKELEFSCGYSLASLNERLYCLPKGETDTSPTARDRFGFLIYSANGESGSYGGITSLFYSKKIEAIINQAILQAQDCPNDPICEEDRGHCFACVDLPETSCEMFNNNLNRLVVKQYAGSDPETININQNGNDMQQADSLVHAFNNTINDEDDILD